VTISKEELQAIINNAFRQHVQEFHQTFTFSMEHMYRTVDPKFSEHSLKSFFYALAQQILASGRYEAHRTEKEHWIEQRYTVVTIGPYRPTDSKSGGQDG
jgi:hypothetical protein